LTVLAVFNVFITAFGQLLAGRSRK